MQNTRKIKATEVQENRFYQLPKWLIHNENFKGLSNDAKILYTIMRDRHELSLKNNWVDQDGFIYMIFTRESMCEHLGVSMKPVIKAVKELIKFKLIDEVRQGCNKPNLLYVLTVDLDNQWTCQNDISRNGDIPYPNMAICQPNDTDNSDTDNNKKNTTGASKDAVVSAQEEVILKDTNIKSLSNHQRKQVATWNIETLIRAIAIYKQLNGQYFKLLKKIYDDGAVGSLIGANNKFTNIESHKWDLAEMEKREREHIEELLRNIN